MILFTWYFVIDCVENSYSFFYLCMYRIVMTKRDGISINSIWYWDFQRMNLESWHLLLIFQLSNHYDLFFGAFNLFNFKNHSHMQRPNSTFFFIFSSDTLYILIIEVRGKSCDSRCLHVCTSRIVKCFVPATHVS